MLKNSKDVAFIPFGAQALKTGASLRPGDIWQKWSSARSPPDTVTAREEKKDSFCVGSPSWEKISLSPEQEQSCRKQMQIQTDANKGEEPGRAACR